MDTKINPERVRELRKASAMSQAELASATSLSIRTIQRIESEGVASLESKRSLASVFEVSTSYLEEPISENHMRVQSKLGLALGCAGVLVGGFIASTSILLSLQSSTISHHDAGIAFAVTATMGGTICAVLGKMYSSGSASRA